ncbi:MAG: dihydrofolate reductase family protein [Polyangiaceae bacterium]
MTTITYYVAVTADGFIAAEDGSFDCFVHDDALIADMMRSLREDYTAVVMGRATYEVGLAVGKTNPYPWLDTYVVTTTMTTRPDPAVTLLRDVAGVAALARDHAGPIWLCGGGALAAALQARGLIDRIVLKRNPVAIGGGIPLFRGLDAPLRLEVSGEAKRYDSGIVVTAYRPARPERSPSSVPI